MTSLLYFEVRFRHKQLQKPLFGQITELQVTNIKDEEALGAEKTKSGLKDYITGCRPICFPVFGLPFHFLTCGCHSL